MVHCLNCITAKKVLKMTYYDKEVQKLGNRQADIQMRSIDGQTRWLTVSPEQVQAILEILNAKEKAAVTS